MQKSPISMFSASQKNSLLDQVKIIVDAGEIKPRSDSTDRAIRYDSRVRRSNQESPRFDSTEILRYTRAIERLNDRYGWHLDAQKVLSKLGKKLGKKCGGGWIAPEKKCKSHYTDGKLNAAGKASGENLADRIRQRKSLSTVSRNGKGQELSYAFMPGNQKQSTMTARRTHAPKTGYQTPGRLSKLSSTEERRSMVGLGQNPGIKSKPDNAPIMDLPTKSTAGVGPIGEARKMNEPEKAGLVSKVLGVSSLDEQRKINTSRPTVEGVKLKKGHKVWDTNLNDTSSPDQAKPTEKTVVGWSKDGKTVTLRRNDLNAEQLAMAKERNKPGLFDRQYPASALRLSKASAHDAVSKAKESSAKSKDDLHQRKTEALAQEVEARKSRESAPTPIEAQTRKLNANPSAGDRIRAVAQTLKDQDKIQKGATVGVLKVAEKLYTNQNNLIDEVSTMVNKDLDRAAARGGKKTFEPTQPQSDPVAKASGSFPTAMAQTRRMNTAVVGSGAGDRLRAIAGKLKDEESIQKVATVGILKAAEKLYVNQHKMIGEVAGIVNEDLDRAAAKGVRKIFDPAKTPVSIPNQRSSKVSRRIGRSVD